MECLIQKLFTVKIRRNFVLRIGISKSVLPVKYKVLGTTKAYLIDTKYQNKEKKIAFLKEVFEREGYQVPVLVS
jgi:hypothetical protein